MMQFLNRATHREADLAWVLVLSWLALVGTTPDRDIPTFIFGQMAETAIRGY